MWDNGHDAYLETRVLTADPLELVSMLYQACTQAVREARHHLAEGRIAERSREVNKACQIVIELATSLDHERGGELSQRLALLYDYMQRRLLEANMHQTDAPLADVLGLLSTLSEAWAGVSKSDVPAVAEARNPQRADNPDSSKAAADNPWGPNSWAAPEPESPWAQTGAGNPWSPVDNPWAQPVVAETGYNLHG